MLEGVRSKEVLHLFLTISSINLGTILFLNIFFLTKTAYINTRFIPAINNLFYGYSNKPDLSFLLQINYFLSIKNHSIDSSKKADFFAM